jgi:hypothetical protein
MVMFLNQSHARSGCINRASQKPYPAHPIGTVHPASIAEADVISAKDARLRGPLADDHRFCWMANTTNRQQDIETRRRLHKPSP